MTANTNLGKKGSQLPRVASVAVTDPVFLLSNTSGNLVMSTVPFGTLCANLALSQGTPANSTSAGPNGSVMYDSSYLYVRTPLGWLRTALSAF